MKTVAASLAFLCVLTWPLAAQEKLPKPLITGLKNPESVAVGFNGQVFVSSIGERGKDGDGAIMKIVDGKAVPFATGLDDPRGLVIWQKSMYVADNKRIWKIDATGKAEVFVAATEFPKPPKLLNDLAVDTKGNLYVSDSGERGESGFTGKGGAIYQIQTGGGGFGGFGGFKGGKGNAKPTVRLITDAEKNPALKAPNGLTLDSEYHLLMVDMLSGELLRVRISDGETTKVADGFEGGDGLAFDWYGRLYISSWTKGTVHVIPRPGQKAVLLASGFESAADICFDGPNKRILVPDMKAGTITALPAQVPGQEVDDSPLKIDSALAFPDLKWTGWSPETAAGKQNALRPVILTHAGDGSNRVFVATQHGVVHVFPNDQKATQTKVFLDIQPKVQYLEKENETGFLGLAFPPDYKKSGIFYAFYTLKSDKTTNVLARFKVSKEDPDKADPASEEILLKFKRPFWNHDGGTLCFGPDGYLYVALGDGGSGGDPTKNGQNLTQLLAGILRLDVSKAENGLPYAIPKDNPFLNVKGARPEKYAYGLRNVWRMSFDRKTGQLWAADVGQNVYEEINIIKAGGDYGWSLREGLHPFSNIGVGPRKDLIDPIWEYSHEVGRSITGGNVYRGKRLPELDGAYIYGDYVSSFIRALRYDETKGRVVANRPIDNKGKAIMSFGEDEMGELYYLTYSATGQGIYWFTRTEKK